MGNGPLPDGSADGFSDDRRRNQGSWKETKMVHDAESTRPGGKGIWILLGTLGVAIPLIVLLGVVLANTSSDARDQAKAAAAAARKAAAAAPAAMQDMPMGTQSFAGAGPAN